MIMKIRADDNDNDNSPDNKNDINNNINNGDNNMYLRVSISIIKYKQFESQSVLNNNTRLSSP